MSFPWLVRSRIGLMLLVGVAGCGGAPEGSKKAPAAPTVTVSTPIRQTIVRYEYATGRTVATEVAEVRARVSGFIKKIHFTRGGEIKAGDPLVELDPALFEADVAKSEAELAQAEARERRLAAELARATALRKTKSISQEDFDKAAGDQQEAVAAVAGQKAKLASMKLNLSYTKVVAPISGVIGDRLVTEGNLISGGQASGTVLATILPMDPIDVEFDLDENTLVRIQEAIRKGELEAVKDRRVPTELGLPVHGNAYPITGVVEFFNNQVDTKTGTLRLKARVANPVPKLGARVLTPGMFVRVRVPIGKPTPALLAPESAFGSDQGERYLYLVGPENKAMRVSAKVGIEVDGLRVVESVREVGGQPRPLAETDTLIVSGIQRVRPGLGVSPKPSAGETPPAK